jgi:hypothetical protein
MATVPYLFAGQVGPIPLSELDANFANCKASTTTANTVADAAQANITSVGILSSLSVSGNVNGANLRTAGQVSATGNVSGSTFVGNVNFGAGVVSGTGNVSGGNLFITGDGLIIGDLVVQGTTTSQNSNTVTTNDLTITVGNNQSTGAALNNGGLLVGSSNIAKWQFNNLTTSWQSNIAITPTANGTLSLGGTSNYWGSAYIANAFLTGGIVAVGTVTGGGGFSTGSTVAATGNITGGNIRTGGQVSATGNVSAASISVSGNIIGVAVNASGAVTASAFNGSGSGLTGIAAGLIVGNCGNALVANSVSTGGFTINEASGILYFSYNNTTIATLDSVGNFTAKGNVTAFGSI